jgi:hypothetical protein
VRALVETIASGRAMLFTGAGFEQGALDAEGQPIPDSETMRQQLWELCFGGGPPDGSSLADLYDVALRCAPDRLTAYIERRLRIGPQPLPAHHGAWLGAPWRRIYTLNVDDLEDAAARQFGLPPLDVVHLNGKVGEPVDRLTFSTLQYASRLASRERVYEQLASDLASTPFVFVGTTLDEAVLWKHADWSEHPRSFLISPTLPRARRELLAGLGIEWVCGTAEELASAAAGERDRGQASARTPDRAPPDRP